ADPGRLSPRPRGPGAHDDGQGRLRHRTRAPPLMPTPIPRPTERTMMTQAAHPYMANSAASSRDAMLDALGISDVEELFAQIPEDHRATPATEVPGLTSEAEIERVLDRRLRGVVSTRSHLSFFGGGYWN